MPASATTIVPPLLAHFLLLAGSTWQLIIWLHTTGRHSGGCRAGVVQRDPPAMDIDGGGPDAHVTQVACCESKCSTMKPGFWKSLG